MCVMHKELVVSIADLRYVCIECPHCRTKVVLDMKEPSEVSKKYNFFTPKECPGCRTAYDTAIQPSIDSLQRSYTSLMQIADRISFRGNPELLQVS